VRYARSEGLTPTAFRLAMKMDGGRYFMDERKHSLPYRLFKPAQTDTAERLPLFISLQSAFGRGDNNISQLDKAVAGLVDFAANQSAFVLAPQCPKGLEWNDSPPTKPPYVNIDMTALPTSWRLQALAGLVQQLAEQYPIDKSRVYLVGASMGATGIWSMLYRYPNFAAGALIMNGRSDPGVAQYVETPVLVFHGKQDTLAPPSNSETMIKELTALGKPAQLQLVNGGHGIYQFALTTQSLSWLASQRLPDKVLEYQFNVNSSVSPP